MMNAPASAPARARGACCPALESPTVIPLAHDGHDRDPLGRRAPTTSGACCRGSRPPARRASSSCRSRRSSRDAPPTRRDLPPPAGLDLAAVAAGDPAATATADAPRPARRRARPAVRDAARAILADVRARGDAAVRDANARVGGGRPDGRLVLEPDGAARPRATPSRRDVRRGARPGDRQRPRGSPRPSARPRPARRSPPGIEIERRWTPLASVGCYVPGGSAPYPVLAGHDRRAGPGRRRRARSSSPRRPTATAASDPVLLGAAGLLEVDALVVAGGAQAIGALAYGLPRGRSRAGRPDRRARATPGSPPPRSRSVGEVGIDLPAGPSEGMVLAAPPADPRRVAADLITQAEHGPDSPAILVTTDAGLRRRRRGRGRRRCSPTRRAARHPRRARSATHGRIVLAPDLDAAIAFVNDYGPEHLSVDVEPLEPTVARLRNAGSLFVGPWAPESAGDYATGANHVLPTGGLARSSRRASRSRRYGKFIQVQRITREGLAGDPRHRRDPGRGRGPARPPRRRRDPVRATRRDR